MLISNDTGNVGIECDLCHGKFLTQFKYYSFTGSNIKVSNSKKEMIPLQGEFDIDVCEMCYDALYDILKANVSQKMVVGTIKCDISNKYMKGDFTYWHVRISMVDVDINKDPAMNVVKNMMDLNVAEEIKNDWENTKGRKNSS